MKSGTLVLVCAAGAVLWGLLILLVASVQAFNLLFNASFELEE